MVEKKDMVIKMPPMLDKRIEDIARDMGSLHPRLHKIRGYLSYIQKRHVRLQLKAGAKILHKELGEMLQELKKLEASTAETKSGPVRTDGEILNSTMVTK